MAKKHTNAYTSREGDGNSACLLWLINYYKCILENILLDASQLGFAPSFPHWIHLHFILPRKRRQFNQGLFTSPIILTSPLPVGQKRQKLESLYEQMQEQLLSHCYQTLVKDLACVNYVFPLLQTTLLQPLPFTFNQHFLCRYNTIFCNRFPFSFCIVLYSCMIWFIWLAHKSNSFTVFRPTKKIIN